MSALRAKQFTIRDLVINETTQRTPYRRRTDESKNTIHWGQRKLHLSEVEFFTLYWDAKVIPNPICVYAGAAPGTHIVLLSQMFPAFTFHLYDPAKFDIQETPKIKLFNEYFTNEVAGRYAGRKDVFLVSDIRTADYKSSQRDELKIRGITQYDETGAPVGPYDLIKEAFDSAEIKNEDQIWGDMGMQQEWVLVMNPEHALLKFRLPYALGGKDRIVQYLKGLVYWQIWPPQTSTETRLKPVRNANGVYEMGDWSILEYEEWCFNHNSEVREKNFYQNVFTGTNEPIDYPELLNDFDSTAEAFVLKSYLEKLGLKDPNVVYQKAKSLSRLMTLAINHYKVDNNGAKTLANKRASPVKSSSKTALDAFRSKKRGKPMRLGQHTAFEHTKIAINPTWRQQTTGVVNPTPPTRQQATAIVIQPVMPPVVNPRTPTMPVVNPRTLTVPVVMPPVVNPRTPTMPVVNPITLTVPVVNPRTPTFTMPPIVPKTPTFVMPVMNPVAPIMVPPIKINQPMVPQVPGIPK